MPRKKVSAAGVIDPSGLEENEQIVIEDKQTIRKERSKPQPADEPEPILGEIEFDDEEEPDGPQFSETSLAALIYDEAEGGRLEDRFCTILVRRKPDRMQDRFVTPCSAVTNYPPLANIEITAERYEIEERVREQYGGGHYFFQIRFENRLRQSWESTLADLPANMQAKPEPVKTPSEPSPAPPPADPMDTMLNSIVKMKALKDALFGDEEARLKEQIRDLKDEIARKPEPQPSEPIPENLRILEKALGVNNPTLQERLIDAAFPEESGGHWIPETVKTIFEHKEEIAGMLGGLLGTLAGPPRPAAPPPSIQDLMRAQPPALSPAVAPTETPSPAATTFKRKAKRTNDTEPTETEPNSTDLKEKADDTA